MVVRAAACVSVRYAQTEQRRLIKLGFDRLCEFAILRGGCRVMVVGGRGVRWVFWGSNLACACAWDVCLFFCIVKEGRGWFGLFCHH